MKCALTEVPEICTFKIPSRYINDFENTIYPSEIEICDIV